MIKNEYRRGLIMLRPIAQGYSGHVRLERRTLMGSMYFIVNGPEAPGELRAALAGQSNGEYYAADLGPLRRDGRGQATLAYTFDPRNIDGRMLEDYIFVVIARLDGNICELVLSGNVDGAREADFAAVQQTVCETLFANRGPAADIPERPFPIQPPPPQRPAIPERPTPMPPPVLRPEAPDRPGTRPEAGGMQPGNRPGDNGANRPESGTSPDNRPGNDGQNGAQPGTGGADRPGGNMPPSNRPSGGQPGDMGDNTAPDETPSNGNTGGNQSEPFGASPDGGGMPDTGEAAIPTFAASMANAAVAADSLPGIDATMPWASAIEGIRRLFATQPRENVSFDDDFVYVRAPMPEGSGFDYVLIGLEVDDGRIEAVRFALPARFSDEPPAGLENYIWIGGPMEGWWVLTADPQTGRPIEFDD